MREITVSITEEQGKYLKEFSAKQCEGSKDNVGTHHPLHLVQTQDEVVVDPDYEDAEKELYHVDDWQEDYDSPQEMIVAYWEQQDEECPIEIVSFDESYSQDEFMDVTGEGQVIVFVKDYLTAYGIDEEFYCIVNIGYRYRTVATFFILDEAKKYIEYQGHNLTNPRTYTIDGGYANKGEYHHFWELLFGIGESLNKEGEIQSCQTTH